MSIKLLLHAILNSKDDYNEGMSLASHCYQAARLAKRAGQNQDVVLACLLHDIGHVFGEDDTEGNGSANHAEYGAQILSRFGISPNVCEIVRNHANAKRYLCFVDSGYFERLSPASKMTLKAQGGPMTSDEAHEFEQNPLFQQFISMRRFDDAAKQKGFQPSFEDLFALVSLSSL